MFWFFRKKNKQASFVIPQDVRCESPIPFSGDLPIWYQGFKDSFNEHFEPCSIDEAGIQIELDPLEKLGLSDLDFPGFTRRPLASRKKQHAI